MFDHEHVYVSLLKHKCLKVKHVSVSCFYSVVTSLLRLQGAGTGDATSTASPFLFPGLPSEVSCSPAVVVTKSYGLYSCRPLHCPVDASSSFVFAESDAYRREGKSGGYIEMKLNKTHFNSSKHN